MSQLNDIRMNQNSTLPLTHVLHTCSYHRPCCSTGDTCNWPVAVHCHCNSILHW